MSSGGTILILGAGIMQLPAIRAAHRMGLRVIVADGNPHAVGKGEADLFEHVDLTDRVGMLEMARRHRDSGGLDAVFTAGTDFSTTVAYVSDHLDLPGTSFESAVAATDKFRMRELLSAAGVRVPRFVVLTRAELGPHQVGTALEAVGTPAVVKPADSMGARGVVRVSNLADALEQAIISVEHSRTGRVVIEGYIDGPEFSIDALVYGGAVQITGFADRHIEFPPYFIEMGHTIPTDLQPELQQEVVREFSKGVAALGIDNGAAKGDMKLAADGPVVGEIAARLSGGYMSGWTFPLSSGVELTEQAIRIALGQPPGSLSPSWSRTSAERAIISIPGVVERIEGVEAARSRPMTAEVFIGRRPGDTVQLPTSNVEKCGNVITVGSTRAAAIAASESAVACIEVVLQTGWKQTASYLFESDAGHWAYPWQNFDRGWLARVGGVPTFTGSILIDWEAALADRPRGPLAVGPAPAQAQHKDWTWRTLADTTDRIERDGLVTSRSTDPTIARLFWRAVCRGGLQGGRYAARSLLRNA